MIRIAVDMTPCVSGGANGGVLTATEEMLRGMSQWEGFEFVLITNHSNHEMLAHMDTDRMNRVNIDSDEHAVVSGSTPAVSKLGIIKRSFGNRAKLFSKADLHILPRPIIRWLYRHKAGYYNLANALSHHAMRIVKPVIKAVIAYGIYRRFIVRRQHVEEVARKYVAKEVIQTASGKSEQNQKCDLSALLGARIDLLYCPFTAINFYDSRIPIVPVLNDILHAYHPYFLPRNEVQHRIDHYDKINRIKPFIISISEFARRTYIETYNYPEERIVTIPLSVQNRFDSHSEKQCEQALDEMQLLNKLFILYPANTWPHKNHEALLIAFAMYTTENPERNLILTLTGCDVGGNNRLSTIAEHMGIKERIRFLGYVSDIQLAALMRSCYYLIFPSLFEGFGIPLAEAMKADTTVLCSALASMPEVCGDCAFYFDPRDPADICKGMIYIDRHPEEVNAKKKRFPEQLMKFDADESLSAYKKFFEELTEKTGGASET